MHIICVHLACCDEEWARFLQYSILQIFIRFWINVQDHVGSERNSGDDGVICRTIFMRLLLAIMLDSPCHNPFAGFVSVVSYLRILEYWFIRQWFAVWWGELRQSPRAIILSIQGFCSQSANGACIKAWFLARGEGCDWSRRCDSSIHRLSGIYLSLNERITDLIEYWPLFFLGNEIWNIVQATR